MDEIFGLLNVDKPAGYTSHDVVDIVRKRAGIKKVGHAGTLDPSATGVLVLCLGQATRLSEYIMGHTKLYAAEITLGTVTSTYDGEGDIISENPMPINQADFEAVLGQFIGQIQQVPPMYSAIKKDGEKLYEKARRGKSIDLEPRDVTIYRIRMLEYAYPLAKIEVMCAPGTYIRSLAYDIGAALGVGGYLSALRRTASGENFTLETAIPLKTLETAIAEDRLTEHIISVRAGLSQFPHIELNNQQEAIVRNGGKLQLGISNAGPIQAWTDEGRFVAVMSRLGEDDASAEWKPDKVFNI